MQMQRLIRKIAERIAADYTRLSIVSNPDGLLTNPVVQSHLLSECGLNVVVGSQLQLRIHYELIYKASENDRFVYVCPTRLQRMTVSFMFVRILTLCCQTWCRKRE